MLLEVALRTQIGWLDSVEVEQDQTRSAESRQLESHLTADGADANDDDVGQGQAFCWKQIVLSRVQFGETRRCLCQFRPLIEMIV